MPAYSAKQRRFMGMELGKKRRGEKTDVDMSESQLSDFAQGKRKSHRKHKRGSSRK